LLLLPLLALVLVLVLEWPLVFVPGWLLPLLRCLPLVFVPLVYLPGRVPLAIRPAHILSSR